jgi:glycosyltransferase involved in cell wall biosynthesis
MFGMNNRSAMADRCKVLLYTHALTGGGCERVWAVLASGLVQRGHDVMLVTDSAASQNDCFLDPRVRRIVLGGGHARNIERLASLLRAEEPAVSISALSSSNLKHTLAAALAGRLRRAVLSYHGQAASEPRLLSRIGYAATPFTTRLTAATVCVSDGLLAHVVAAWKGDPRKTRRIYNPVDVERGTPVSSAAELAAREPLVIAVGRLVADKGFLRLVRAFARIPSTAARLVILGEGDERGAIEAEIARLGLGARVILAGYVENPWEYYAKASCFVLTSEKEAFGLVVVEALGAGLPVVATDCEGPREILAGGSFGRLVPPADETALCEAIAAALADPGDPRARVERARYFSVERGIDQYEALIEDVAAAARPHSASREIAASGERGGAG